MLDYHGNCTYRIEDIYITPFRKRKPISIAAQVRDLYEYRKLNHEERAEYAHQEYMKYCTEDQLWEAIQEVYHQWHLKRSLLCFGREEKAALERGRLLWSTFVLSAELS